MDLSICGRTANALNASVNTATCCRILHRRHQNGQQKQRRCFACRALTSATPPHWVCPLSLLRVCVCVAGVLAFVLISHTLARTLAHTHADLLWSVPSLNYVFDFSWQWARHKFIVYNCKIEALTTTTTATAAAAATVAVTRATATAMAAIARCPLPVQRGRFAKCQLRQGVALTAAHTRMQRRCI